MKNIYHYTITVFVILNTILLVVLLTQSPPTQNLTASQPPPSTKQVDQEVTDNLTSKVTIENFQYKSLLKTGNFTFAAPENTFVTQSDAGGRSAISIYENEESAYQASSIIYSILFLNASEFESGVSLSFEEWLERENILLTGKTKSVGGLEFSESHKTDSGSLSLIHYFDKTESEQAYVLSLPIVKTYNDTGISIEKSLNFNPTAADLDNAKTPR